MAGLQIENSEITFAADDRPRIETPQIIGEGLSQIIPMMRKKSYDTFFIKRGKSSYHPFFLSYHKAVISQTKMPILMKGLKEFADKVSQETNAELLVLALKDHEQSNDIELFFYATHPAVGKILIRNKKATANELRQACFHALSRKGS